MPVCIQSIENFIPKSNRDCSQKGHFSLMSHLNIDAKILNKILVGLPWWHSGWESACRCRGHGFEPWSEKIPHAAEQLGPWATTTEPARLEPVLRNKRGCDSERPAHRNEEWPPLAATRESPHTETKTQHSQKTNKQTKNKNISEQYHSQLLKRDEILKYKSNKTCTELVC